MNFTYDVIVQSFSDKFDMPKKRANIPAIAGNILTTTPDRPSLVREKKTYFRLSIGKLIHVK